MIAFTSKCSNNDILLCFNNLPPFFRCQAKVIVYVHAPHFVDLHANIRYGYMRRFRIFLEKIWFKFGSRNVDQFWVQTESMFLLLSKKLPTSNIKLVSFLDKELSLLIKNPTKNYIAIGKPTNSLIYPADFIEHKNHQNLLAAWNILLIKHKSKTPRLFLTIANVHFKELLREIEPPEYSDYIINLGPLDRNEVLLHLNKTSALIFPSLAETFGLPLIEATAFNLPIIASERDYVRDVCIPDQTFDPLSPRSIARAVERMFLLTDSLPNHFTPQGFLLEIFKSHDK